MEFFSAEFWSALCAIIVIDLVLAGDNAIVIGLAARKLPKGQQKKVIFWGTLGAIAIRSLLTLAVVWLLKIPGLVFVGGLLLVWVAYKLLVEDKECENVRACESLWAAIKTIIIADAVMGLDNILAIAGAAHGNFFLVILGLLISVPIIICGSALILVWVERYPAIIYVGAGVLAWTASKMIASELFWAGYFENNPLLEWGLSLVIITGVIFWGRLKNYSKNHEKLPLNSAVRPCAKYAEKGLPTRKEAG